MRGDKRVYLLGFLLTLIVLGFLALLFFLSSQGEEMICLKISYPEKAYIGRKNIIYLKGYYPFSEGKLEGYNLEIYPG